MNMIPLQIMSAYTLLRSTITIDRLVSEAQEQGNTAIGLAEHNVMYGAIEFYKKCKKANINPLIGLFLDIKMFEDSEKEYPVLLYAKNYVGYQCLISLSTQKMAHLDKQITLEQLGKESENLIVILPLIESELLPLIETNNEKEIKQHLKEWSTHIAPDSFYLGVSILLKQSSYFEQVLSFLSQSNIPSVALDSIRTIDSKESFSLNILEAISEGKQIEENENQSTGISLRDFYSKKEEYIKTFGESSVLHTQEIAKEVDITIPFHQSLLPKYDTPATYSSEEYLLQQCLKGLEVRVQGNRDAYKDRLESELSVIKEMGFSDYFLIVWDLMRFARTKHILTGAGRGSAAGSLVSYVLFITDVDPIKYDLLFERFLNSERKNMPDIDLDFPDDRREEMLEYVKDKYGLAHVAQIATFGTLAAKMAIRDTGRVMGLTQEELSEWSKAIPTELGINLQEAYKKSFPLQKLVSKNTLTQKLFETASFIEGLPRHVGTHAAGVVISDRNLEDIVPLQSGNGLLNLTQYTMDAVEELGLLKMDFLGLKNLTILSEATQLVKKSDNPGFSIDDIPKDDSDTLEIFRESDTVGIFQFESDGIKNVLKRVQPYSMEDVASVNALYRPGPMEQIDVFAKRKNGELPIEYLHPDLKPILQNTYGVMVYQEQVMQVASKLGGYTLGEADILRRAISKKEKEVMKKEQARFVKGAVDNGYSKSIGNEMYAFIARFANYGFNRSHAVAYSFIAYQMAYLKAHYPAPFFTALLNSTVQHSGKMQEYLQDVKKKEINIKGININQSQKSFTLINEDILLGFKAVKGLRRDFIQHVLYIRRTKGMFTNFIDFIKKIDSKWRKKEWVDPLIFTGAFDEFGINRSSLAASLETIVMSINMSGDNVELFDVLEPNYQYQPEMELEEQLDLEFSYTGLYLSGHPTDFSRKKINTTTVLLNELKKNKNSQLVVLIKSIKRIKTKRGEPMAFADCQDSSGNASLVLFPETYRKYGSLLVKGTILLIEGKAEKEEEQPKVIVRTIKNMTDALEIEQRLFLKLPKQLPTNETIEEIGRIVSPFKGNHIIILVDEKSDRKIKMNVSSSLSFEEIERLKILLGPKNVVVK